MSELSPIYRSEIEDILGRPLVPEELAPAERLESLSEPVLQVARQLRRQRPILCAAYLHALVPKHGRFLTELVDDLPQ